MLLVLAGCGRPLQVNPPPAARSTRPTSAVSPRPASVVPSNTATRVPGGEPTTQPVQELPTVEQSPTPTASTQAAPTSVGVSPVAPATPDVIVIPRTPAPLNNEQRWRAQQVDRQVLPQAQVYIAKNPVPLLWYDPLTGQSLEIGMLLGEFWVQARFTLHSSGKPALEVPYKINADYGLTSISDAVRERMRAAGYTESVEAYASQTEDVAPR